MQPNYEAEEVEYMCDLYDRTAQITDVFVTKKWFDAEETQAILDRLDAFLAVEKQYSDRCRSEVPYWKILEQLF